MITMDSREYRAHPNIYSWLAREFGAASIETESTLDFGDYSFLGCQPEGFEHPLRVGIELCSISDVCGKLDSGRLSFQLTGMLTAYDVRILLIGGTIQSRSDGCVVIPGAPHVRVQYNRLMGTLLAAQAHGVIVTYAPTHDHDHVGHSLSYIYRYFNKPYEEHKLFRPQNLSYDAAIPVGMPVDPRIQTLMTLPGIGEDRALAALGTFGSLFQVFTASEAMLKAVPGWGSILSKRVYDYIWRGVVG